MTTSHDVVLYGGRGLDVTTLPWPVAGLPYLMIETIEDGIAFLSSQHYQHNPNKTVLRFHAFGEGGDLLVRQDEQQTYWRFVGQSAVLDALGLNNGEPHPDTLSYDLQQDEAALLWGEYDRERKRWYENRVGKATLDYPHPPEDRVMIHAHRVVDDGGKLVAYWTYGLAAYNPQTAQEAG